MAIDDDDNEEDFSEKTLDSEGSGKKSTRINQEWLLWYNGKNDKYYFQSKTMDQDSSVAKKNNNQPCIHFSKARQWAIIP